MPNARRQRQKAGHRETVKVQRAQQRRRGITHTVKVAVGVVIGLVIVAAVLWKIADTNGVDGTDTTTTVADETPTTAKSVLVAPTPGASITGTTPCPPKDGSAKRTTHFAKAPPLCLDRGHTYTATFDTSKGKFTATLDTTASPEGVNNFIVLARYKFYDGIPFHRVSPGFVIQAGDPVGQPWGTHGPGYTIGEEPPGDLKYDRYDLAFANASQANSTGSQFFVISGDPASANQRPTYTFLGKVVSGKATVDAIAAVPTTGSSGDVPLENVVIKSVTITES